MNNTEKLNNNLIEIKIDFIKGKGDPARVFRAMTGLIESTQLLDEHLSATISTKVRTTLVLQDIEVGSIKSKLKTIIEQIPDEPLKQGDVNAIIGTFLHRAKHKVLDWCSERNAIKDRDEIKKLEREIYQLAEKSDIKLLPAYVPIETATLLSDISSIKNSLVNLEEEDKATFVTDEGTSQYNNKLDIAEEIVRELITRETIVSEGDRILKIKKPDYLGSSKWVFKYADHLIDAKISDESWLYKFHSREIILQPGDSLRVRMREEISYGYSSEIVHVNYDIVKVHEVIQIPKFIQGNLLD